METLEEQQIFLDMIAYRLTVTDPSGIHERRCAALKQIDEALEGIPEDAEDVMAFESFRSACEADRLVEVEWCNIENGYRVRLGLDAKPNPWDF